MAPGYGIHGQPCSQYAWELQDLHMRMAAAIAQIRYGLPDVADCLQERAPCNVPAHLPCLSLDRAIIEAITFAQECKGESDNRSKI